MGFKSGARGAAATSGDLDSVNLKREQAAWAKLLGPGEQINDVVRLGRSTLVFTNRRLVIAEEALTGRKVEYLSLPYRVITSFAVEASGQFSPDADLRIWVTGRTAPIEKQFGSGSSDVYAVQGILAQHVAAGG